MEYNKNVNYITEFWKVYFQQEFLFKKIMELSGEIKEISSRADRR
jgi:hypothetical protein